MTERVDLRVNRDLLDPQFEGYKVAMENWGFESKKLEHGTFVRRQSTHMISLQHLKIFANENNLFADYTKSTEHQKFLYRFTDTGIIEKIVYNAQTRLVDVSAVVQIENVSKNDEGYPMSMAFTEENLVVVCDGVNQLIVFRETADSNWQRILDLTVCEKKGLVLQEARKVKNGLHVLMHRVDDSNDKETKSSKSITKMFYINIGIQDLPCSGEILSHKILEFDQGGHYEASTFTPDGDHIIVLATEKPKLGGDEVDETELKIISREWKQHNKEIVVHWELNSGSNKEDVRCELNDKHILVAVKDLTILEGKLSNDVEKESLNISVDKKSIAIKFTSLEEKKWEGIVDEGGVFPIGCFQQESTSRKGFGKPTDDQICGADEMSEDCDSAEPSLFFFLVDLTNEKILKQYDVSGRQVLFIHHNNINPAVFCLRHDVDGIIWSFAEPQPNHVATLQAFGYVQASKTSRIWSGSSPNNRFACIAEANNRVMVYSQNVAVEGNLVNRRTSSHVTHIAKQHLLRIETSEKIRGVQMFDDHIFALTDQQIHAVALV